MSGRNTQEIERKWLIDSLPDLQPDKTAEVEQGYLSFAPTVRIRRNRWEAREDYWLTIKGAGTLTRTEIELPLTKEQYEALKEMLAAPTARKRYARYPLPGGMTLECSAVDEGEPTGFCYAEVEFATEEEAVAFQPPAFFGREVTEEPGYTMAAYCRSKAGDCGFGR